MCLIIFPSYPSSFCILSSFITYAWIRSQFSTFTHIFICSASLGDLELRPYFSFLSHFLSQIFSYTLPFLFKIFDTLSSSSSPSWTSCASQGSPRTSSSSLPFLRCHSPVLYHKCLQSIFRCSQYFVPTMDQYFIDILLCFYLLS